MQINLFGPKKLSYVFDAEREGQMKESLKQEIPEEPTQQHIGILDDMKVRKQLLQKIRRRALKKAPVSKSTTFRTVDGVIEIHHSQGLKQSINYQSADLTYGATIRVKDSKKSFHAAVRRLERVVEDRLTAKFAEQRDALKKIAEDAAAVNAQFRG
jgi:hypothetical protein